MTVTFDRKTSVALIALGLWVSLTFIGAATGRADSTVSREARIDSRSYGQVGRYQVWCRVWQENCILLDTGSGEAYPFVPATLEPGRWNKIAK